MNAKKTMTMTKPAGVTVLEPLEAPSKTPSRHTRPPLSRRADDPLVKWFLAIPPYIVL